MFRRRRTRIAEKLKIVGSLTAEGAIEVNGNLEGDLTCASLDVSRKAHIRGSVQADRIVVNGTIEGPIRGRVVVLRSRAHVVGDIMAKTLSIEKGAFFDGRSASIPEAGEDAPARPLGKKITGKSFAELDKATPASAPGEPSNMRVVSGESANAKKKGTVES
jgi:cytoskeletal protein CcmA (bactofilin family)